jgi:hypothetical protein
MSLILTRQIYHFAQAGMQPECPLGSNQPTVTFNKKGVKFSLCHSGMQSGIQERQQGRHALTTQRSTFGNKAFINVFQNL